MRYESSVTSVSWIPSEAITGAMKLPMAIGVAHYDDPLPDHIEDLDELRSADRFRFANELKAWIDVEDGRVVDAGYSGGGHIGATTLRLGLGSVTIPAVAFPDLQAEPVIQGTSVRFVQTTGGRTGAPVPRHVRGRLMKITAPTAWTTLGLTIIVDGSAEFEVVGASPFPRHWIYDAQSDLAAKSGLIDFKTWSLEHFGDNTPWGDVDSPAVMAAVESALERKLSLTIMRGGAKPTIRKVKEGEVVTEQGAEGNQLFLLLDGVLTVEVDGEPVAEVGPGSVLGERAVLEGGVRTSTLRALTPAKVAVASAADINPDALAEVASGHRREEG